MEVIGQLHAPAVLPPGKGPGTHCRGGRVNPRTSQDVLEKIKVSGSCQDSNPGIFQPVDQSLYHLRCSGSCCVLIPFLNMRQKQTVPFLVRDVVAVRVSVTVGNKGGQHWRRKIEVWVPRSYGILVAIWLSTFRANIPNPYSRFKQSSWTACPLNNSSQPTTNPRLATSQKSEDLGYTAVEAWNLKLNFNYVIKKTRNRTMAAWLLINLFVRVGWMFSIVCVACQFGASVG
jgi:hypothetical protein